MDKAFLVGINAYDGCPLSGCVNDVTDMAEFLTDHLDFNPDNIRLLTDKRATTSAIWERVAWLVEGAKPGDRLVFHFSGHGVEMPSRNPEGEVDRLDQCACPVDFDWEQNVLRDDDFISYFSKLPQGVKGLWLSDSCHSGGLDRDLLPPGGVHAPKPKFMQPPPDIAWRFRSIARKAITSTPKTESLKVKGQPLPLVFISGCKTKQTSADAWFGSKPNGAATYYLLRALTAPHGLTEPMSSIIKSVRSDLKRNQYTQIPQLDGLASALKLPLFG